MQLCHSTIGQLQKLYHILSRFVSNLIEQPLFEEYFSEIQVLNFFYSWYALNCFS